MTGAKFWFDLILILFSSQIQITFKLICNSMHILIFKIQINGSYPDLFYCSGINYIDFIPAPRIIYIYFQYTAHLLFLILQNPSH
jgi:hypothetical protein